MHEAAESAAVENRGFLGEIEDFGQSALHTALESPINGAIQFIDHAANIHLPEVNIIGAPTHDSWGSRAGAVVGAAADLVALSVATGGVADILGGAGLVGGLATAAATGAIYGGILTPSDDKSEHFFEDRLENGAVGAATFAAMGGAANLLGATGVFAVPEARSLLGSLTFGGLSGAAGGAANAEATAVFKEGKVLPSAEEFFGKVGSQALFGAAYGGLGYAYNQVAGPASHPTTTDSGTAKITTVNDAQGNPVSFQARVPSANYSDSDVLWDSTKMTDGTWRSSGYGVDKGTTNWSADTSLPKIDAVTRGPEGTVVINDVNGNIRTFAPGQYSKTNPAAEAAEAAFQYARNNFNRLDSQGNKEVSTSAEGYRKVDPQGRTLEFRNENFGDNGASIKYDANGEMNNLYLTARGKGPAINLDRTADNVWRFSKGDDYYTWQGKVEQIKDASGLVKGLSFTPANGKPMVFDTNSGTTQIATAINEAGQYQGIQPDLGWAKVSENGQIALQSGRGMKLIVNGQETQTETVIKPGDNVVVKVDVGDRYTIWEDRPLKIGTTPDGKPTINQKPVSGRAIELRKLSELIP